MSAVLALLGGSLTLGACDQTPPATRTWTPEDHAHPNNGVSMGDQMEVAPVDDGLTTAERTARSVYVVACAGCHGARGHGDGPERAPVMRLPDFASPSWQASRTDEELLSIISLGRGMMPAFGDRIPPDGLRALVGQLRAFGPAPVGPGEASDAGVDGPPGAATEGTPGTPRDTAAPSAAGASAAEAPPVEE